MHPTPTVTSPVPCAGLSAAAAAQRLGECGPNEITREERASGWRILFGQFSGAMFWLLLGASVLSLALGERADAVAILAIVALNGLVGFLQEYRAERALGRSAA